MGRSPEEILREAGVVFVVHEHTPVSSVAEILAALPFPAEQHVKTLAVVADGRTALVALRGSDRLHFGRLSRALGVARDRLSPLSPDRVCSELGLEPGGVCLLVERPDVERLVDERVLELERAFTGSGRADRTLELEAADLVAASKATVAAISQ
jgi:Cys-tRNA(Pro)/Cys-tRNA(Cys) deacylase